MHRLTPREKEVYELILKGYTNQQIADELITSIITAKAHTQNIYRKLGCKRGKVELLVRAIERLKRESKQN
jgi:DNA-binding NarL/FixJ family response regulator